ncbi:hypothetical protein KIPE111705_32950 [Kibdelosporangium persicum]|uniref:Uncharacterized protein n=1 Tax=Kibdelosporangium persicum TaxID=2698649 RepID=A0ABX2FGK7_9PSEU|nr:hypothetical protein [Kibdelosporangium persicum]NRN70523.1 hypothetical protein [Kibdelosporangium persicum]
MSTYPTTATHGGQAVDAAPKKPGTLVVAWAIAILTGLAAVACGLVILTGGVDLAKEVAAKALAEETGMTVDQVKAEGGELLLAAGAEEIKDQLAGRAYILMVPGVLALLFALMMGKAATWSRVLVTIFATLTLPGACLIAFRDYEATTLMLATAWIAVLAALITIVLTWLGPNNRYARAVKQQRA